MNKNKLDILFIIGFLIAHALLFFTYNDQRVFWYMFTASMLILISYSILSEDIDDKTSYSVYLIYGVISGIILFFLFFIGNFIFELFNFPIQDNISRLYQFFSPTLFWQYLSLMLIAVPGEEIFWRGFIQKRLLKSVGFWGSIFISSLMYASINVYTGEWILIFATFISGIVWGFLYAWKRSIPLLIVSHLVFDLFIFILFPL